MTLKARNRIFLILLILSTSLLAGYMFFFVYAAASQGITPPENPVRFFKIFPNLVPFKYMFSASVIGICIFIIYVCFCFGVLYFGFEKTQSLEIIYFICFLLGCLCEGVRFVVPFFDLWKTQSKFLILTGRIVLGGRILCPLSMLAAALFSDNEQRQNIGRNFVILILIGIITGAVFPLQTNYTTSTCIVLWANRQFFTVLRTAIFLCTAASIFINAYQKGSDEIRKSGWGYLSMMMGYYTLGVTDNYFCLVTGTALLFFGTILYLREIHRIYMWK